jgi:hypothetical protein
VSRGGEWLYFEQRVKARVYGVLTLLPGLFARAYWWLLNTDVGSSVLQDATDTSMMMMKKKKNTNNFPTTVCMPWIPYSVGVCMCFFCRNS